MDQGQSFASRRGHLSKRGQPRGIIIHTSGSGVWTRRCPLPFDRARVLYEGSMKYSPHYLVCGETGRTVQINDLSLRALHVGSKGSWKYRVSWWQGRKRLHWWNRRFPQLTSPRGLFGGALWQSGSANELGVGIEVSPPLSGPRDKWTDACWEALKDLVGYLTVLLGIPKDRYHVITHSDAHPLSRITKSGAPWDPSPRQWRTNDAAERLGFV